MAMMFEVGLFNGIKNKFVEILNYASDKISLLEGKGADLIQDNIVAIKHKLIHDSLNVGLRIFRELVVDKNLSKPEIFTSILFISEHERRIDCLFASDNYGLPELEMPSNLNYKLYNWQAKSKKPIMFRDGITGYFLDNRDIDFVSFDPQTRGREFNYCDIRDNGELKIRWQLSYALRDLKGKLIGIFSIELAPRGKCNEFDAKEVQFFDQCFQLISYFIESNIRAIMYHSLSDKIIQLNSYLEEYSTLDFSVFQESPNKSPLFRHIFNILKSFVVFHGELFIVRRIGPQLVYSKDLVSIRNKDGYKNICPDDYRLWRGEPSPDQGFVIRAAEDRQSLYLPYLGYQPDGKYYKPIDPETRSQFTVPMIFENRLLGVLNFGSSVPCSFWEADRLAIEIFTNMASVFLFQSQGVIELKDHIHKMNKSLKELRSKIYSPDSGQLNNDNVNDILKLEYNLLKKRLSFSIDQEIPAFSTYDNDLIEIIKTTINYYDSSKISLSLPESIKEARSYVNGKAFETVIDNLIENSLIGCASLPNEMKVKVYLKEHCLHITNIKGEEIRNINIAGYKVTISNFSDTLHLYENDNDWIKLRGDKDIDWTECDSIGIYQQYQKGKRSKSNGSGLGLWICDQIASKWGGYISLREISNAQSTEIISELFIPARNWTKYVK